MKKKYPELYSDEFVDFCLKNIVPLCKRDNRIQKEHNKNFIEQTVIIVSVILVFISYIMIFGETGIFIIFGSIVFLPTIFFLFLLVLGEIARKQIYTQKEDIFPILFSFYNKDCKYLTTVDDYCKIRSHIERLDLHYFGNNFEISKIDDIFKIKYKGLDVEMCEFFAVSYDKEDQCNNNAIEYGSNLFFKIRRKNPNYEKTIITGYKKQALCDDGTEIINLESTEFNKKFKVYSTSQIEARKILTPLFMKKLYDVCFYKNVNAINLLINKSSINIIVSHPKYNLFEASYLFQNKKSQLIINLRRILIEHIEFLSILDELGIEHLSKI